MMISMHRQLWVVIFFLGTCVCILGQFGWHTRDAFDEIQFKLNQVNADNCNIKHVGDLHLPADTVSHKPDIKDININPVFPNRTHLLHIHNLAMSRAFFWSYSLQARFIRPAVNDTYDPGMMYYFLSTVADVASNPFVNASAIYFSPNMSYTPSYRGFFNKTMPLFAPRTFRMDDYNDPIRLQRLSTNNTFDVRDLGAIPPGSNSMNYSSDYYRINDWYKAWLPDNVDNRHDTKTIYHVRIRYANNTNETFTFHGPLGADENPGPVKWTRPYFDCSRSNKWLIAAVVPIVDIYPRHTQFRHIEYPTYTAVSVVEMDFDAVDINPCPKGEGNSGPNRFADIARCQKETTECEPLHGYRFRRGGYQCRCRPGFRLPNVVRRPYLGEIIERASSDQYYNSFNCEKIGWIQKLPVQWERAPHELREMYLDRNYMYRNSTSGAGSTHTHRINIDEVIKFLGTVTATTCKDRKRFSLEDLELHGDIAYKAENQFENEAQMAVRLANFFSAFLQVVDSNEVFPGRRVADQPLNEDQVISETLALLLGNTKIWGAGTYWDRKKFNNRTYFAPYAYKRQLNTRKFQLEDLARLNKTDELYLNNKWFKHLKARWSTNFDNLEKYYMKIQVRNNETGEYLRKYEHYPMFYRAASLNHGHWTLPYFDCYGKVKKWVISYAAPFFGWDSLMSRLEFKGAVAVTMDLMTMDIDQCPDKYWVPNAFKDTHKCDRESSACVPILGRGFETGGYKCECLQGYEYPFEDSITYFDGQLLEAEFENLVKDTPTRFDMLKCRIAGALNLQSSCVFILSVLIILLLLQNRVA